MRPSSGGDALASSKPTSRKSSIGDRPRAHSVASSNVPTTFFIRSEKEMEDSQAESPEPDTTTAQPENTYGVESLADTLQSAFGHDGSGNSHQPAVFESEPERIRDNRRRTSSLSDRDAEARTKRSKLSPRKQNARFPSSVILTPSSVSIASQAPNSAAPSTPKSVSLQSLRLSDEEMESGMDDVASQAIASSGDEDEDDLEMEESGSFPQLVMPSIQMPSRRPFTTKGKAMGRLKVLVAGEAGLGKTSLIRSIVQLCEDIVHVDPLSSPLSSLKTSPSPKSRKRKSTGSGTARITEIHASTKAYPPWWTDMEDNRGLRRRKSMSDSILERNVCFVDTPGFGKVSSGVEEMNLTIDYIESLLYRNATMGSMSDGDLLGVISGNGGVQVDLVIYMLSPTEDISNDIQFMQRLSSLTNVIPVIAKADTLSPSEILLIKTSILARLQTTSVKPFLFGKQLDDALLDVQGVSASTGALHSASSSELSTPMPAGRRSFSTPTYPYAICSTAGLESDTMDASLLMASDYLQPLLPSELASLVAQIFDPDSISWLRHSAAKKFLSWRRQMQLSGDSFTMHGYNPNQQNHSPSSSSPSIGSSRAAMNASGTASILSSPSPSGVLVPRPNSPFYLTNSNFNSNLHTPFPGSSPSLTHTHAEGLEGPSDFSIARYYNQMHREERFAEVRLAKWAADLQRSLRNERERFEELQRAERAKWLLERVGEEVRDGNILSSPTGSSTRADWAVVRHGNGKDVGDKVHRRYGRGGGAFDSRDPLGLCDLGDEFRKKSFAVVKFLGGISVVGAVVLAVFRVSGWQAGLEDAGGVWGWVVGGGGGGE